MSSDYTFTTDRSVETVMPYSYVTSHQRSDQTSVRNACLVVVTTMGFILFAPVAVRSAQSPKLPPPCNACDRTEPDGVRYS